MFEYPDSISKLFSSLLAFTRRFIRRLAAVLGGAPVERFLHRCYHRVLRSTGRFEIEGSRNVMRVLDAIAGGASTFIDAGANAGRFSWYFFRIAPARARIYAFEPNPDAFQLLEANLRDVRNARCFRLALGAANETRHLHVPLDDQRNAITPLGWIGGAIPVSSEFVVEVAVDSIDGMIQDGLVRPEPPIFLKLDVEGAEQEVLEGAEHVIMKQKPIIYFECEMRHLERNGRSWEPIWRFLTANGYSIWSENEGGFARCSMIQPRGSNYFAVHDPSGLCMGNAVSVAEFIGVLGTSRGPMK